MYQAALRDIHRRSQLMIMSIWIFVFLNIFCVLLCLFALFYNHYLWNHSDFLTRLANQTFFTWEAVYWLMNIFSGIVFIMWSYRANRNLNLATGKKSPRGFLIIAGWFIPVASWFVPYRIMRRLFAGTMDELETTEQQPVIRIVNAWWFWWIALAAYGYAVMILNEFYSANEHKNLHSMLKIVSMILALAVDWTTIRLIRKYKQMEMELFARRSATAIVEEPELIDRI
jgi:hypothetical protein